MTGMLLAKERMSTTGRGAVREECCRPLYDGKNDEGPGVTRALHMEIINFNQYGVDSRELQITSTVSVCGLPTRPKADIRVCRSAGLLD